MEVTNNQEDNLLQAPRPASEPGMSQSDRGAIQSSPVRPRRLSEGGVIPDDCKLSFLHVVKKVRRVRRDHDRSQALSRSMSASRRGNDENPFLSERAPLSPNPKNGGLGHDSMKNYEDPSEYDEDAGVAESEANLTTTQFLIQIILGKGIISACLLVAPFAILAAHQEWDPSWIFWLNFIVMIPLAAILGDFTEEVALHTNETIGGLINATFGNAVEVVVGIQALLANEIRVLQASMLGSIFSNLLLVLGCCFFFGGLYHSEQRFNVTAASANMGLLALSSIALVLPTPFAEYYNLHDEHVLTISRVSAVFLIFMYMQLLFFQLKTHAHVFDSSDGDDDLAVMPFWVGITGLLITTLLVTIFSEYLVDSIGGFTENSGISRTFVGIILLPIVGNAVEHITAVTVAMKNKMDLAMGVAVGSCTQISLFVVPLMVLAGWATDKDMTLNFPHFEIILFTLSVLTVSIVVANPTCNWLEGSLLMTTYLLIAVGFWFENVKDF